MSSSTDRAVVRVIEAMYQRVGDELTVDEMARTAMYSKFHFSRMFRHVTGVSPGRFLSAVRFQEAKRLLAATSLSVAEISNRVGYSSLGTFSTRFKISVGMTPTEYRQGSGSSLPPTPADRPLVPAGHLRRGQGTRIHGRVCAPSPGDHGATFVGLFPDPIPHRTPVRCAVLARPGPYLLEEVPDGTWYLLAHSAAAGDGDSDSVGLVGRSGPIVVRAGTVVTAADVLLRPMRTVDLPVLRAPFVARPPELQLPRAR